MKLRSLPVPAPLKKKIAVCADFHSVNRRMPVDKALSLLASASPDLILFPGDIFSLIGKKDVRECFNENGFSLLKGAAGLAPCFFSPGNHECGISPENRSAIEALGVTVLDNEFVKRGELVIGGLSSGYRLPKSAFSSPPDPEPEFLGPFAETPGYHILLCHHPEYWPRFVCGRGIELTAAGHAHGGQWRIFGRGVFAPGQGLFPRYTSGIYGQGEDLLAVSRGMTNSVPWIPRFFNPCEILLLSLSPEASS